jgi:hypothetical protein
MPYPFQLDLEELQRRLDEMVDSVWSSLQSNFLVLPRGPGFTSYNRFATAYDVLQTATHGFRQWDIESVWSAFERDRLVFLVIRTMLGVTPPEWGYLTTVEGKRVDQRTARRLDRVVRDEAARITPSMAATARALLGVAVQLLSEAAPTQSHADDPLTNRVGLGVVHRFDKGDTRDGLASIQHVASMGVPYAMLLYERFLGRPWASHKDSISEMVGDVMEAAVEQQLTSAGVVYRKTKRRERIPGFSQAPDFIVPDE